MSAEQTRARAVGEHDGDLGDALAQQAVGAEMLPWVPVRDDAGDALLVDAAEVGHGEPDAVELLAQASTAGCRPACARRWSGWRRWRGSPPRSSRFISQLDVHVRSERRVARPRRW